MKLFQCYYRHHPPGFSLISTMTVKKFSIFSSIQLLSLDMDGRYARF